MKFDGETTKQILLKGNYVSEEDLNKALKHAKEHGSTVEGYLLQNDILNKDLLGQAYAEYFGVPYADLNSNQPSLELIQKISEEVAKKFRIVLFKEEKKSVTITTDDPKQEGIKEAISKLFPRTRITLAYSLPEDIDTVFLQYQKPLETRFAKIIEGASRVAPSILTEIFEDAILYEASDIHFEPQRKHVVVRFRVDGVLLLAGKIPREYYENILNRIKVQSGLRIDEHFTSQDGSMRYETTDNKIFDLRTSIVPTVEGEKVVLRILSAYVQGFGLGDIGLSAESQGLLMNAAKKPFGMILVTGPTGSGKTTTLYSVLRLLNRPEVNITTIEDPVEYKLVGVNQIQVNQQTKLTFARGLRSIVRQDPDIILVGEIRDHETAEIGVNAALTGHLLLSTFHSNDAATAVPRLLDMGIEPFLLASTLEVLIAQRLVRKICDNCRYSVTMTSKQIAEKYKDAKGYFSGNKNTLYAGKGCNVCGHTGYDGRIGIFEFIKVTPEMQELILTNPSSPEINALARSQGTLSLFEDGVLKVKSGATTLEELFRVAPPPATVQKMSKAKKKSSKKSKK